MSCDPGHVILMRGAIYGRMRPGRCIGGVSLGCKSDVLSHLDKLCSGRRRCKIDVNDLEKVAQPCPKDYKAYLEAEYECVRGTHLTFIVFFIVFLMFFFIFFFIF